MTTIIYAYIIGSAIVLLIMLFLLFKTHSSVSDMTESLVRMRDKGADIDGRVSKIEKAVDWFLETKGLKLERRPTYYKWTNMPTNSYEYELDDAWKQIQRHREELVYAIYEANKRALEDHENDKRKKRKKKS